MEMFEIAVEDLSFSRFQVSQPTPPIKTGPPIDINDDDLESLWNRVKDNADLKYPKSMAGLAVLTSYRQRTLEAETSADDVTLPWTEIYRPRSTKEFIGNRAAVQQLLEWLRKWKKRLQRQEMNLAKSKETASKKRKWSDVGFRLGGSRYGEIADIGGQESLKISQVQTANSGAGIPLGLVVGYPYAVVSSPGWGGGGGLGYEFPSLAVGYPKAVRRWGRHATLAVA